MKLLLKNELSELARLSEGLEDFGRTHSLPARTVQELNLALDELVTNTITHGFAAHGEGEHRIEIEILHGPSGIDVTLLDNGKRFNPFEAPDPDITASLEDRPIGGLGVFLVKQLMDGMDYVYEAGRNCVRLHKNVPPEVAD